MGSLLTFYLCCDWEKFRLQISFVAKVSPTSCIVFLASVLVIIFHDLEQETNEKMYL